MKQEIELFWKPKNNQAVDGEYQQMLARLKGAYIEKNQLSICSAENELQLILN